MAVFFERRAQDSQGRPSPQDPQRRQEKRKRRSLASMISELKGTQSGPGLFLLLANVIVESLDFSQR